jgi:hypothetical protein
MRAGTGIAGSAAAAVLMVGVMGMSQVPSHAGHQVEPDGGATSAYTKQEAAEQRRLGALPKLTAKVNDARDLTISANPVASGRYKIVVRDSTSRHNWHILGNGVDKETGISATGRFVFRVRLRDGNYTVQCDVHPGTMNFTLRVN